MPLQDANPTPSFGGFGLKHVAGRNHQRDNIVHDPSQDDIATKACDRAVAGIAQPLEASPQLTFLPLLPSDFIDQSVCVRHISATFHRYRE